MAEKKKNVDVIIPTYKPDESFLRLMEMLEKQSYPVGQIIVMNTEEIYFAAFEERFLSGTSFTERFPQAEVYHHRRAEFDHGRTRDAGVCHSKADIFVCMTQDAVPADYLLMEHLARALAEETVAVAYGRQLPGENADEVERFTRVYNYPDKAMLKSKEDLEHLGIKTYFCSNVCAAYKREVYNELGGFVRHTIFNEDMIFAAGVIKQGRKIAYVPEARIYHSHHYTGKEQFKRNFDLGVSQADHPEIFGAVPSEGEGIRMIKETTAHLRAIGKRRMIPGMYYKSACKYLGYCFGKHYKSLPKALRLHCTGNREYWQENEEK